MTIPMNDPIPSWRDAYGRKRPGGDHVYVVRWPDGVVKVGWSWYESRWSGFVNRGAKLIALFSSKHYEIAGLEPRLDRLLAECGRPAFASKNEAIDHLGSTGAGYLECYRVDESGLASFLYLISTIPTKAV